MKCEMLKMIKIQFTQQAEFSVDAVWRVIGNFGRLSNWATQVVEERVEDRVDGKYRIITLRTGAIHEERLVHRGDYFYTYSVNRSGTAHYEATVAVEAADAERAAIVITVEFLPKAGVDVGTLTRDISAFFQGSLKAMMKAVQRNCV